MFYKIINGGIKIPKKKKDNIVIRNINYTKKEHNWPQMIIAILMLVSVSLFGYFSWKENIRANEIMEKTNAIYEKILNLSILEETPFIVDKEFECPDNFESFKEFSSHIKNTKSSLASGEIIIKTDGLFCRVDHFSYKLSDFLHSKKIWPEKLKTEQGILKVDKEGNVMYNYTTTNQIYKEYLNFTKKYNETECISVFRNLEQDEEKGYNFTIYFDPNVQEYDRVKFEILTKYQGDNEAIGGIKETLIKECRYWVWFDDHDKTYIRYRRSN